MSKIDALSIVAKKFADYGCLPNSVYDTTMNYSTYFENKKRYESTLSPKDFEDMRISEQKAIVGIFSIISEIAKKD